MRKEYDFSKSKKNSYAYKVLINLFLRDRAATHKKPSFQWKDAA
jgi:hypothetical protein